MLKSELIMSRKVLRNSPCTVATVRNGWGYFWVGKLPLLLRIIRYLPASKGWRIRSAFRVGVG